MLNAERLERNARKAEMVADGVCLSAIAERTGVHIKTVRGITYDARRKAGLGWNDERIALLKKLRSEGQSASQIAMRLGGVTRNAVIGKVHRLGLSGRVDPCKRVPRARRVDHKPKARTRVTSLSHLKKVLAVIDPLPDPDAPLPGAKLVSLVDLDDRGACRFPHGEGPFTFCGCPAVPGAPYCADHARLAFRPMPETTRREFVRHNRRFDGAFA